MATSAMAHPLRKDSTMTCGWKGGQCFLHAFSDCGFITYRAVGNKEHRPLLVLFDNTVLLNIFVRSFYCLGRITPLDIVLVIGFYLVSSQSSLRIGSIVVRGSCLFPCVKMVLYALT